MGFKLWVMHMYISLHKTYSYNKKDDLNSSIHGYIIYNNNVATYVYIHVFIAIAICMHGNNN